MLAGALLVVPATRSSAVARAADEAGAPAGADAVPMDSALEVAAATGRAVNVPSFTTETDTLDARPDGKLALTQSLVPVRKLVDGDWTRLDNGDGTAVLTVDSAAQVSTLAPTAASTVQAVDVSGDTVPDLRVVTGSAATAYVSNATGSALTAQPSQTLSWS